MKTYIITIQIIILTSILINSKSFAQVVTPASVLSETQGQVTFGKYVPGAIVKISQNYLCHDKNSPYFTQTAFGYRNNFATAEECAEAGFGLPKKPYFTTNVELYARATKNVESLVLESSLSPAGNDPGEAKLASLSSNSAIINPNSIPKTATDTKLAKTIADKAEKEKEETENFGGFGWNPALVLLSYRDAEYIEDVRIESGEDETNGTIFVGRKVGKQLALMLEAHYFWDLKNTESVQYGLGPFVSVSLATQKGSDLGSVIGLGAMLGLRRKEGTTMNIGLGVFYDTDFQTLRDGLKDGDTTTFTDSADLIQRKDVNGVMLLFSSTF
jgi:hypothetical protein